MFSYSHVALRKREKERDNRVLTQSLVLKKNTMLDESFGFLLFVFFIIKPIYL